MDCEEQFCNIAPHSLTSASRRKA